MTQTNTEANLNILVYNTHLFGKDLISTISQFVGSVIYYQDELRNHIITQTIKDSDADIVGLVEVWNDGFASTMIDEVKDSYPYHYRGPHGNSYEVIGHGLLLLSKYPLSEKKFYEYKDLDGFDKFSRKGFLTAKAEIPNPKADKNPIRVRFFLTHTQAASSDKSYEKKRQANIAQLTKTIEEYQTGKADNSDTDIPVFAFGDFNVIGEDEKTGQSTSEYNKTLDCFQKVGLFDFYRKLDDFEDAPGYTYFSDGLNQRNKLIPIFDKEGAKKNVHQRLDYIFYSQENSSIKVTPTESKILTDYTYTDNNTQEDMDLSDHEPLWGKFNLGT